MVGVFCDCDGTGRASCIRENLEKNTVDSVDPNLTGTEITTPIDSIR